MEKFKREMTDFFDKLYPTEHKLLVFGEGDERARVMLIGEAPGEQETMQGRPFVGRAGKNLDEFLELSGLSREALYITNTVKFRPVKHSKSGGVVNRPPTREEVELFLSWLQQEIELVKPQWIVTLGNVALRALMGRGATVGACHGKEYNVGGRRLFALYHPASILYNPAIKAVYRNDVIRLGELVRADE